MKKIVSLFIVMILCVCSIFTVSADSIEVDFGDVAGKAGDVDVDTYISASDIVALRKVLLGINVPQSKKTIDVNKDDVMDVRDLIRLKKILANAKELYFSQGTTTICGSSADKTSWMYKMNDSGLLVRESDIDLGTGSNTVEIIQLSDFHLVNMSASDFEDPQLSNTYDNRKGAFSNQVRNVQKALEYASYFDAKIVVTGDSIDYLGEGNMSVLKKLFGNLNPIVTVGNHEFRKIWYGNYEDTVDETTRYNALQAGFPYNNIFYHSEVLKNRVMIISMNNGADRNTYQQYYAGTFTYNGKTGTMDTFLAADLATAKEKGYAVLIFEHCPISTGKSEDAAVKILNSTNTTDLYSSYVGGPNLTGTAVDQACYKLITENAALIKGLYSGHIHSHTYSTVKAKLTPESTNFDAEIPQYNISCNAYDNGCALRITLKY